MSCSRWRRFSGASSTTSSIVQGAAARRRSVAFRRPPAGATRALPVERLRPRLAPARVHAVPPGGPGTVVGARDAPRRRWPSRRARWSRSRALFLATVVTTLLAGTRFKEGFASRRAMAAPGPDRRRCCPFAAMALLGILGVHEFGHYARRPPCTACRSRCRTSSRCRPFRRSSWGRMGAVIRLRGRDPRSPVAVRHGGQRACWPVWSLPSRSRARPPAVDRWSGSPASGRVAAGHVQFGDALLPKLLERLTLGSPHPDFDIPCSIPSGVLPRGSGSSCTGAEPHPGGRSSTVGHIVYALFGSQPCLHLEARRRRARPDRARLRQHQLAGVGQPLIVGLMGFRHAPTMDDITPLGRPAPGARAVRPTSARASSAPVPLSVQ